MDVDGEFILHCTDEFCRVRERMLRHTLYQWRRMPADMIMKDITTVRNDPRRLWEWSAIAIEETLAFADRS